MLEGFRSFEKEPTAPKIVAVKIRQETIGAPTRFRPILAFTGPLASPSKLRKPFVDVLAEPMRIAAMVRKHLSKAD